MSRSKFIGAFVGMLVAGGVSGAMAADRYVAQNGQVEAHPYITWAGAASNIQAAVDAASVNDTVWVGPGLYTLPSNPTNYDGLNVVYINKPLILRSSNSVPETTIIDGGGVSRGIMVHYNNFTSNRFVIDGFTVSNGYAEGSGGGIYFDANRPSASRVWTGEVYNCVLTGNVASNTGGGLYAFTTDSGFGMIVSNCVFRDNRSEASAGGGIMFNAKGTCYIGHSRFERNLALTHNGGGVYATKAMPLVVENCVFDSNLSVETGGAGNGGGGLYVSTANEMWVRDCLFYGNRGLRGGAVNVQSATDKRVYVENCTIVSNYSPTFAVFYIRTTNGQVHVANSIIHQNALTDVNIHGASPFSGTADMVVSFSNVCTRATNGLPGSGNFTNLPGLIDVANGACGLARGSPCINAGINLDWMANATDLEGRPRIDPGSGVVDIGCYEFEFPGGTLIMVR